jgi:hypothetical protein
MSGRGAIGADILREAARVEVAVCRCFLCDRTFTAGRGVQKADDSGESCFCSRLCLEA